MPIYLTYDNQTLQDGFGAQALRILGIYSIAKTFRFGYIHSPISKVIEEYSHNLQDLKEHELQISRVNDFFAFPSTSAVTSFNREFVYRNITRKILLKLIFLNFFSTKKFLVRILLPYGVIDKMPSIYKKGVEFIHKAHANLIQTNGYIVCHIRWGYGYLYSDQDYIRPRHLPFSYFEDAVSLLYFKKNRSTLPIIVHTDLSRNDKYWTPAHPSVLENYRNLSGNKQASAIPIKGVDLEKKLRFPKNSMTEIKYCDDFFSTFLDMSRSEILVMGTSTFSFLAGLINPNMVIWPQKHVHSKYPGWTNSEDLGIKLRDDLLVG